MPFVTRNSWRSSTARKFFDLTVRDRIAINRFQSNRASPPLHFDSNHFIRPNSPLPVIILRSTLHKEIGKVKESELSEIDPFIVSTINYLAKTTLCAAKKSDAVIITRVFRIELVFRSRSGN